MKIFRFILLISFFAQVPCQAQAPSGAAQSADFQHLPDWLITFSNLAREDRAVYLELFNEAKAAYAQGEWVTCITRLADCELIFEGNPNVWNLRACCLMEQKYFNEAEVELQRALQAAPQDPVTIMNVANLQLAQGKYRESLQTLAKLRSDLPDETSQELLYVLDFRALLCHLMLGQPEKARELVKDLNPMSDTPLYYYSKAAFAMAEGNRIEAARNLQIVRRIYAKGSAAEPYQRSLNLSALPDKLSTGTPES